MPTKKQQGTSTKCAQFDILQGIFFLIECLKNGVEEMFKGTLLSAIGKTMYKDDRVKAVRIQLFPLL